MKFEAVIQHLRQTAMTRFGPVVPNFSGFGEESVHVQDERRRQGATLGGEQIWSAGGLCERDGGHAARLAARSSRASPRRRRSCSKTSPNRRAARRRSSPPTANRLTQLSATVVQMRMHSDLQVEGFSAWHRHRLRACPGSRASTSSRERLKLFRSFKLVFGKDAEWQTEFQRNIESMLQAAISKQMEHALGLLESELKAVWVQIERQAPAQLRRRDAQTTRAQVWRNLRNSASACSNRFTWR